MNQLTFMYDQSPVRTVVIDNQPWLVAKDICDILEIQNTTQALQRLEVDEVTIFNIGGLHGEVNVVNEYGMYSLILGSRKTEAKAFKRWVTHEVLPQIRKTGSYNLQQQYQLPQNYAEALRLAADLSEEKQLLVDKIEADKPLVHFAESLQISKDSILVGELAKLLRQKGIMIGEIRLFQQLREEGYLVKSGSERNNPTQRSMELGIMEIKIGSRNGSDGVVKTTRTTKITGKGQIYFINKLKGKVSA